MKKILFEGVGTAIATPFDEYGVNLKEFKKLLIDNGIKQQFIADKLEISKQSLNLLMNKKHITFDDMQKLLACIGYELRIEFVPVENVEK